MRRRRPSTTEYTPSVGIWPPGHQGEEISLRIGEERHPERLVPRLVDHVRVLPELDPSAGENAVRLENVRHVEVEYGGRVIELRGFRSAQHEADRAGLEEGHSRRFKEEWQRQHVAIEGDSAGKILRNDRDLADIAQNGWSSHGGLPVE